MISLVQRTIDAHGGTPFLFAMDGVATEELQPWRENGETWRRLKVAQGARATT